MVHVAGSRSRRIGAVKASTRAQFFSFISRFGASHGPLQLAVLALATVASSWETAVTVICPLQLAVLALATVASRDGIFPPNKAYPL